MCFDWEGVSPEGRALQLIVPFQWDLSQLYSTGQITLTGVAGALCPAIAFAEYVRIDSVLSGQQDQLSKRSA